MIKKLLKTQRGIIQRMLTTNVFRSSHRSIEMDEGDLEPHVSRNSQNRKSSSSSQILVYNTQQKYSHQLKAIDVLLDDFQRMEEQSRNVNEGASVQYSMRRVTANVTLRLIHCSIPSKSMQTLGKHTVPDFKRMQLLSKEMPF